MNNKLNISNINEMQEDTKELVTEVLKLLNLNNIKNVHLNIFFEYVVKVEDKRWNNATRNYYLHNVPVESLSNDAQVRENILRCNKPSIEEVVMRNNEIKEISQKLQQCTDLQKNRYMKHNYLKMTFEEIVRQENVSESTIRSSIKKVLRKLNK